MLELDFRSRQPIYEQLVDKFKQLIISNVLKPDEQLPPVRVLAGQLTVNPNTIQKAYRELEHRGYIYSVPGKGNFVMPAIPEKQSIRLENLKHQLVSIILEMHFLGMKEDDIIPIIKGALSKEKGGANSD